jgi:hypothetical protein
VRHSCGHEAATRGDSGGGGSDRGGGGVASTCPAAGDRAAVVDVADNDAPPLGGAHGETDLRQLPSLHRKYWWCGRMAV